MSKCLKVDEFDHDVGIVCGVDMLVELLFHFLYLGFNDEVLLLFGLGLSNGLDQLPQVAGQDQGCIFLGEQIIHIKLYKSPFFIIHAVMVLIIIHNISKHALKS